MQVLFVNFVTKYKTQLKKFAVGGSIVKELRGRSTIEVHLFNNKFGAACDCVMLRRVWIYLRQFSDAAIANTVYISKRGANAA